MTVLTRLAPPADAFRRIPARGLPRADLRIDIDNHGRAFALDEDAGFRRGSGSSVWRKPFTTEEPRP